MRDPRDYLAEIDANLRKIQAQGQVTATENALFGMIDGLAGLQRTLLERVTLLEARVGTAPITRNAQSATEEVTYPTPAERRTTARRGRTTDTESTAARGPDTRNATVNPDGAGAPPIPVATSRTGRPSGKSRPDRPATPGRARKRS